MANDPYKVLGIDRTATDEEVKKAYRELARKYHPDNYVNTPLADLAEEKMKEINEAYETIRKQRKAGEEARRHSDAYGAGEASGSYGPSTADGEERFREIRRYIAESNFYEAEIRLNSIPNAGRSAEWYFLKGVVFRARGWYFEAARYFEAASRMDPQNEEYRIEAESIRNYTSARSRRESRNDAACNLCCNLLALDCCCECCGGDLISCC